MFVVGYRRFVCALVVVAACVGYAGIDIEAADAISRSRLLIHLAAISDDMTAIGNAASSYDTDALRVACAALGADIDKVNGASRPKGISATAWRYVLSAFTSYGDGAILCIAGARSLNEGQLSAAADLFNEGTKKINLARALL